MKRADFCRIYKQARNVNILDNDWFNCMGWFWLNLTELQARTMYNLILSQGAEEKHDWNTNRKFIEFKNGMRLYREG